MIFARMTGSFSATDSLVLDLVGRQAFDADLERHRQVEARRASYRYHPSP